MSCDPSEIFLYVDGELAPEDAAKVRAHVSVCAECRMVLSQQLAIGRHLDGLDNVPTPQGFADTTATKAKCDLTHAVGSPRERRNAAAFVACLACAAVALLWPTGLLAYAGSALAPLRCLGKFALSWTANSLFGALIVAKTFSTHLVAGGLAPLVAALVVFGLLLVALVILISRYHRGEATREPLR